MAKRISNVRVGRVLGYHDSTISRWRNDGRVPENPDKEKIGNILGWSLQDQVRAELDKEYGPELEEQITAYFERNPDAGLRKKEAVVTATPQ